MPVSPRLAQASALPERSQPGAGRVQDAASVTLCHPLFRGLTEPTLRSGGTQLFLPLLLGAFMGMAGCATAPRAKLEAAMKQYWAAEGPKACALALDSSGAWAWGVRFRQSSVEEAKRLALADCEGIRPVYMIRSECVLYAVNDLFVYGTPPPEPAPSRPRGEATSTGTCFAIRPDGIVLTANHIVRGARSVTVTLASGALLNATLEASSDVLDLAVLRVPHGTPDYLLLADPGATRPGSRVFTLGFPAPDILGPEAKYSDGAVSSMSGPGGEAALLQITVPVQPGNSGGPVVDSRGRVVGIVTSSAAVMHFLRETGTLPQNVNWAISAEFARPLYQAPPSSPQRDVEGRDVVDHVRQALCSVRASIP